MYFFNLERARDPSYATASRRGVYDETADRMICEAIMDNQINILHNYDHLCYYCCFIFSRYFGYRGGGEVSMVQWDQVNFLKFTSGPYTGCNYVELRINEDKGNLLLLF